MCGRSGLFDHVQDIGQTVLKTQFGTPLRVSGYRHRAARAEDPARPDRQGHSSRPTDALSTTAMWSKASCCCARARSQNPTLAGIHDKVKELNEQILPPGVKVVPFLDRSDLLHFTTHTVLHNLTEGIILVVIILFLFLGNVRGALIVALTIPFSLLFASICLDLNHIPANLLSLGALDFGMVVDGAVVMVENIVRHLSHRQKRAAGAGDTPHPTAILKTPTETIREAAHEVQRPVFYAIAHHHHRLSADLHAADV